MNHLQEPVRLGVMSFAHGHIHAYIQAIAGFTDAAVVACWDDDRERGAHYAARYGIDFIPQLDQFLSRDDIDAVFITSPTNRHAAHVAAAAQAGKHILLQKPMALTLADCDAIIQAVPRPLINYLKGEGTPLATAEDGRVGIEMILGAYQSAREGRRVQFPL